MADLFEVTGDKEGIARVPGRVCGARRGCARVSEGAAVALPAEAGLVSESALTPYGYLVTATPKGCECRALVRRWPRGPRGRQDLMDGAFL